MCASTASNNVLCWDYRTQVQRVEALEREPVSQLVSARGNVCALSSAGNLACTWVRSEHERLPKREKQPKQPKREKQPKKSQRKPQVDFDFPAEEDWAAPAEPEAEAEDGRANALPDWIPEK